MQKWSTAEGLEPAEDEPLWFGGADCHRTMFDEYERSGASWSYSRTILEAKRVNRSYDYLGGGYNPGNGFDVQAKLHIWGKRRAGRYVPTDWSIRLELGKYSDSQIEDAFPRLRGKCRSILDAQRKAAQAITDVRVAALVAFAYSRNRQTVSVYRLKDDVPRKEFPYYSYWVTPKYEEAALHESANWEPWASDLDIMWGPSWMPPGCYLAVSREHDGTLRGSLISHSGGSTSSSSSVEIHRLAQALGGWTSTAIERLREAAPSAVWSAFRDDAKVKFETRRDPEYGTEQQFIVVETTLDVDEGDRRLRKLEDQWWLKVMPSDGSLGLELRHMRAAQDDRLETVP